jgi:hypothetical protein
MTRDGGGDGGPYEYATEQNTSMDWLNDLKPVQAKLNDMHDYAKALSTIATNLQTHRMRVIQQIGDMVEGGAFGGGFPEVDYAGQLHGQNLSEFNQYLQNLFDGLQHSANASQAIADAYAGSDGFSAISLNTVQFAFGDPSASRPEGLPAGMQTFSQNQAKAMAAAAAKGGAVTHDDAVWTPMSTTVNPDGGTTQIYTDQYGETRKITVSIDANGHHITTNTGPEGTTTIDESSYSYPLGTYSTSTTTDTKGKVSTSGSETYDVGGTTITDSTSGGKEQSQTTVSYSADGSQTKTTYVYDDKDHRTISERVTVGADNPVDNGAPDSPANDTIEDIRAHMPKDDTKILAPGPAINTVDPSSGADGRTTA